MLALLFFNLTFIALGSSYIPTEYSIICMFRKHFENILPFSEIIFVLLQAYLLILLKFRMWFKYGLKAQKLLAQGIALGIMAISKAPCFTLIEQALSVFLTLIIFNDPWVLPDEVCVIVFTFFHEGEYDP